MVLPLPFSPSSTIRDLPSIENSAPVKRGPFSLIVLGSDIILNSKFMILNTKFIIFDNNKNGEVSQNWPTVMFSVATVYYCLLLFITVFC